MLDAASCVDNIVEVVDARILVLDASFVTFSITPSFSDCISGTPSKIKSAQDKIVSADSEEAVCMRLIIDLILLIFRTFKDDRNVRLSSISESAPSNNTRESMGLRFFKSKIVLNVVCLEMFSTVLGETIVSGNLRGPEGATERPD